jgi:hypothetical protein
MFNGNKFNSSNFNTTKLPIGVGGIFKRIPYVIEIISYLNFTAKKKYKEKIYLNIIGKKKKEQIDHILISCKVKDYIKNCLKTNILKSLNKYNEYNIISKKSKKELNYIYLSSILKDYIKGYISLKSLKSLYDENKIDIINKKSISKLLKSIEIVTSKIKEEENSVLLKCKKTNNLTNSFDIEGDLDFKRLFFILNL